MFSKVLAGVLVFFVIVITIVGLVKVDEAVKIGVTAIIVALVITILIGVSRPFFK